MVRDPRDVVASFIERLRSSARSREDALAEGLTRWLIDVPLILEWRHDPHVLVVRYEDLIGHPRRELDRVFAFLEIAYDFDDTLAFHKRPALFQAQAAPLHKPDAAAKGRHVHDQRRAFQINQPLFDGRDRWRQPYPAGLSANESALVGSRCQHLMPLLDYALEPDARAK
jgi:hypothetical protein